jgi:hypothetical protein
MKPAAIIARANNHSGYRNWTAVAYKIDALTWNRVGTKFLTQLPSEQRLEVSFFSYDTLLERHSRFGIKLDEVDVGWFDDTKDIPSVAVRIAVEALVAYITPLVRNVIEGVKARQKLEEKADRARISARSRELEAERAAKLAEAIRKADGH